MPGCCYRSLGAFTYSWVSWVGARLLLLYGQPFHAVLHLEG